MSVQHLEDGDAITVTYGWGGLQLQHLEDGDVMLGLGISYDYPLNSFCIDL